MRYVIENLGLVGWTNGDGSGHDGYRLEDFFEADGSYRGPDKHGIEPIVEDENGHDVDLLNAD